MFYILFLYSICRRHLDNMLSPLTVWLLAVIFIAVYILFFVIYEYSKKKIVTKKLKHENNTDVNGILEDKSVIIDENHDLNKENDKKY